MSVLIFFVLSSVQFSSVSFAADNSGLVKGNPKIDVVHEHLDFTKRPEYNGYTYTSYAWSYSQSFTTIPATEDRKNIVPQLGNNPTCRSIRDSIVNLCSRKLDKNEVKPQYFQVDPKTILKAKEEIDILLKETLPLLDKYKQDKKIDKVLSKETDFPEDSLKKCLNQIDEAGNAIADRAFDRFKKAYYKISKSCIDKVRNKFEQKNKNSTTISTLVEKISTLEKKLIESETVASVQNAGVDIYSFTKESPCESLRIDYNNEGDLHEITIVKRNDKDNSYKIRIDNNNAEKTKKDSISCRPELSTTETFNSQGQRNIDTEFGIELWNIIKRTQNTDLFTHPDNRRTPVQKNEGPSKN